MSVRPRSESMPIFDDRHYYYQIKMKVEHPLTVCKVYEAIKIFQEATKNNVWKPEDRYIAPSSFRTFMKEIKDYKGCSLALIERAKRDLIVSPKKKLEPLTFAKIEGFPSFRPV